MTKESLYQADSIIKRFGFNNIPLSKSFLDSLYNGMREDDNPILFIYELNPNL